MRRSAGIEKERESEEEKEKYASDKSTQRDETENTRMSHTSLGCVRLFFFFFFFSSYSS